MILGVFSDLHSNVYALDAMLAVATDVDQWISLGDSVGLLPPVNEVLDKLRSRGVIAIRGNHEECLLSGRGIDHSFTGTESLRRQRDVLSEANWAYLRGLGSTLGLRLGGREIRALHALHEHDGAGPAKYALNLHEVSEEFAGADIVMFGDTHLPVVSYCRDLLLVNPGSCGFPIDVTRRPSFAVVDTSDLSCGLRRFDYDRQPLLEEIRSLGYNPALYRFIQTGSWGG